MKIAHLSDIHFGRIAHASILDALVEDIEKAGVDLIAVSGDITQRARHSQFKDAVAFLGRLPVPQVILPGNHDVFPWWRPFSRIFRPVARFQKYLGEDLVRSFEMPGLALLGINSAHGLTVKGGKITPASIRTITRYFSDKDSDTFKILMLHHHLMYIDALMPHDISRLGPETLQAAIDAGVNLILCGHVHVSHVETLDSDNAKLTVIASAGTATSDRGRRTDKNRNVYNLIEIEPDRFTINQRAFHPLSVQFNTEKTQAFDRPGSA